MGSPALAEPALDGIYRQARQAAVEILVDGHHSGSGAFISGDGRVLTAAHVIVRPERRIEILTASGGRLAAEIEAVDLGHDIVLLSVPADGESYTHLALADRLPPPGETVLLCSSAAYRRVLLQTGTMARDDTTFEFQGHFLEVTQIAALIQEGTSGGAWINQRGELIGVQSGSVTVRGANAGIANVAPVAAVRQLVQSGRSAQSPTVGAFVDELWLLPSDNLRRYPAGSEGMIVQSLTADGPAARADIREGDVITACDGQPVRFRDALMRRIHAKQPGQQIELTVLRPGESATRTVSVGLDHLEAGWPSAGEASSD